MVLSIRSQKQTTKFAMETADIPHDQRKLTYQNHK
jgi:hypothetical protein